MPLDLLLDRAEPGVGLLAFGNLALQTSIGGFKIRRTFQDLLLEVVTRLRDLLGHAVERAGQGAQLVASAISAADRKIAGRHSERRGGQGVQGV